MPSFLELTPKWHTATVFIETPDGVEQCEVTGIPLSQLAAIAKRFPAFNNVIEGNGGLMSASEAMAALVGAGLGHFGDAEYEAKADRFPAGTIMAIAMQVWALTFPPAAVPLGNGVDVAADAFAQIAETAALPKLLNS